ncbi:hypothetical protein TNCV_3809711 [Trichonephila clavipes]|nr:hypothetical protein TNCV_3809711 [Trichonephila clavipes]
MKENVLLFCRRISELVNEGDSQVMSKKRSKISFPSEMAVNYSLGDACVESENLSSESDPVDKETDEDEDNNSNESSNSPSNADAFSALETAMEWYRQQSECCPTELLLLKGIRDLAVEKRRCPDKSIRQASNDIPAISHSSNNNKPLLLDPLSPDTLYIVFQVIEFIIIFWLGLHVNQLHDYVLRLTCVQRKVQ